MLIESFDMRIDFIQDDAIEYAKCPATECPRDRINICDFVSHRQQCALVAYVSSETKRPDAQ